jgi:hypothetical protein
MKSMSEHTTQKKTMMKIEVDASDLTPQQVRLIKSINTMLHHVLITENEEEYFEGSAEFMRMCASIIKQARFTEQLKGKDNIPYAQQALEYSMDVLNEYITNAKVVSYDN